MKKAKKKEELIEICPKCGSSNTSFNPIPLFSMQKCKDCGYRGSFISVNKKDLAKIRERLKKKKD